MKTGYTKSRVSRKCPTFKILKGVNDMANMIVDNAKVMSKGQITLPKEIREQLGIGTGDRVTLICEGDQVVMMNAAVYAMKMLQGGMQGEAAKSGLETEEDIDALVNSKADKETVEKVKEFTLANAKPVRYREGAILNVKEEISVNGVPTEISDDAKRASRDLAG